MTPVAQCYPCVFFFSASGPRRDLHSFPTRRSSDLGVFAAASAAHSTASLTRFCRTKDSARRRYVSGTTHPPIWRARGDRKSTRLNSSHTVISYAVFCLKKKKHNKKNS